MAGIEKVAKVVCEVENRGRRSFIIALDEHISGGLVEKSSDGSPRFVRFNVGTTIQVTEACGAKLSKGWKDEVRILRKITKKG